METITPEQVLKASPEELKRLNTILARRAMVYFTALFVLKGVIYWGIHQSAKKYWNAS